MQLRLIGMVHLGPLPGAPHFQDLEGVRRRAVEDASTLHEAGFDAICVENHGDAPFFAEEVPAVTVSAMTSVVASVMEEVGIPVGVNVLRNDAMAALAIAAVTSASFIRVNVLTGIMYTDQGIIHGKAADVARARRELAPWVDVLADVFVKHAVPPPGLTFEQSAADTWWRGGAQALIVTGSVTGQPADLAHVRAAKKIVPEARVLVGSGVTVETVAEILTEADGVIVGSAIKEDGHVNGPVSLLRARALVEGAGA